MSISKTKRAKLKLMLPNNCWYCGAHKPDTIDHVTPVSKGGKDDLDNLVFACRPCNSGKRDLSIRQFRFVCSWKKTKYSKTIGPIDAMRLIKQGVKFNDLTANHKFWFEGL